MHTNWDDLSRAVVLFVGLGQTPSPRRDRARLIEEFGEEIGSKLEATVTALLDEASRIEVDWSTNSLESAGRMARETLRSRHPKLSEPALRALEWTFTYNWR